MHKFILIILVIFCINNCKSKTELKKATLETPITTATISTPITTATLETPITAAAAKSTQKNPEKISLQAQEETKIPITKTYSKPPATKETKELNTAKKVNKISSYAAPVSSSDFLIAQESISNELSIQSKKGMLLLYKNTSGDNFNVIVDNGGTETVIPMIKPGLLRVDGAPLNHQTTSKISSTTEITNAEFAQTLPVKQEDITKKWIENLKKNDDLMVKVSDEEKLYYLLPDLKADTGYTVTFKSEITNTAYILFNGNKQYLPEGKETAMYLINGFWLSQHSNNFAKNNKLYKDYYTAKISAEIIPDENTKFALETIDSTGSTSRSNISIEIKKTLMLPIRFLSIGLFEDPEEQKIKDNNEIIHNLVNTLPVASVYKITSLPIKIEEVHTADTTITTADTAETIDMLENSFLKGIRLANKGIFSSKYEDEDGDMNVNFNEIMINHVTQKANTKVSGKNNIGYAKNQETVELPRAIIESLVEKDQLNANKHNQPKEWNWNFLKNTLVPNTHIMKTIGTEDLNADRDGLDSVLTASDNGLKSMHTPYTNIIPFYRKDNFDKLKETIINNDKINYSDFYGADKKILKGGEEQEAYEEELEFELTKSYYEEEINKNQKSNPKKHIKKINELVEKITKIGTLTGFYDPICKQESVFYPPIYSSEGVVYKTEAAIGTTSGISGCNIKINDGAEIRKYFLNDHELEKDKRNMFHVNFPALTGKTATASVECCCGQKTESYTIPAKINDIKSTKFTQEIESFEIYTDICNVNGMGNIEVQAGTSIFLYGRIKYSNGLEVKVNSSEIAWYLNSAEVAKPDKIEGDETISGASTVDDPKTSITYQGIFSSQNSKSEGKIITVNAYLKSTGKKKETSDSKNIKITKPYTFENQQIKSYATDKCITLTDIVGNGKYWEQAKHIYVNFQSCGGGEEDNQKLTFNTFNKMDEKFALNDYDIKDDGDIHAFGFYFDQQKIKIAGDRTTPHITSADDPPDRDRVFDMITSGSQTNNYKKTIFGYYKIHAGNNQQFSIIKICDPSLTKKQKIMIKTNYYDGCVFNQNYDKDRDGNITKNPYGSDQPINFLTTNPIINPKIEKEEEPCSLENNLFLVDKVP